MSWPTWSPSVPTAVQPVVPPVIPPAAAPTINPAPAVAPPPGMQYTPEQWAQMQQQNWEQWAQWQQRYQQWHQQYGAEYQKSMSAISGTAAQPPLPAMPNMGVPPPTPEKKPPLPPEEPPHQSQPPSYSTMPPKTTSSGYSSAPPNQFNQPPNREQFNQYGRQNNWQQNNKRPYNNQGNDYSTGNNKRQATESDWSQQKPIQSHGWPTTSTNPPPVTQPKPNMEELSEAEKKFDKEFAAWESQFTKWKEQNSGHPDKDQYKEYEKKWESWRNSLLERREQMRRKRLNLLGNSPLAKPNLSQPPPLVEAKKPALLPAPVDNLPNASFSKPPPNLNNEPLSFKPPSSYPGEDIDDGNTDGFLKSSSSGGIPGLDLVKEEEEKQDVKTNEILSERIDEASPRGTGPDFDAISKGINSILGDQKLLSMLSMVSQNQSLTMPNKSTDTTSKIMPLMEANIPPPGFNEQSNQSLEERSNQGGDYNSQRESVNNFDDQTRSSFTLGPGDQEFSNNNFGRNSSRFPTNNNNRRFEGAPDYNRDNFDDNIGNRDNFQCNFNPNEFVNNGGGAPTHHQTFGPGDSFNRGGNNQRRNDSFPPDNRGANQHRNQGFSPMGNRDNFSSDFRGSNQNHGENFPSKDNRGSTLNRSDSFQQGISRGPSQARSGNFSGGENRGPNQSFDLHSPNTHRNENPSFGDNRGVSDNFPFNNRGPNQFRNNSFPLGENRGPIPHRSDNIPPNENCFSQTQNRSDNFAAGNRFAQSGDDFQQGGNSFDRDDSFNYKSNLNRGNNNYNSAGNHFNQDNYCEDEFNGNEEQNFEEEYFDDGEDYDKYHEMFNEEPLEEAVPQVQDEAANQGEEVIDEGIFEPATVIDYEHKSLKTGEDEILIEPIHMFDYRHKPLNRIPLPQRPKWLSDSVKTIREFDPVMPRYDRRPPPINYREEQWFPPPPRGIRLDDRRPYESRRGDLRDLREEPKRPQFEERRKFDDTPKKIEKDRKIHDSRDDFEELSDDDMDWNNDVQEVKEDDCVNLDTSSSTTKTSRGNNSFGNNVTLIEDLINPPGRFTRAQRLVIVLRGPPGSGKTYLAKLIKDKEVENGGSAPRILSLDDYFMVEHEKTATEDGRFIKVKEMVYEYEADMEDAYRTSLLKSLKKTITDGYFSFIIVDDINDKVKYFGEMWSFAKQNGFQVFICQLDLDPQLCAKRNVHGRTLQEIEDCVAGWEPTPSHHPTVDVSGFLQSTITEVEMEEVQPESNDAEVDEVPEDQVTSKWDNFDCSVNNLARLDGVSKPLRPSQSMEEYLQLEDDAQEPTKPLRPGQKRVRWADLEEQKQQAKMRAIGFIVGQTNWNRLMDPSSGGSALTQTKYIERVKRY